MVCMAAAAAIGVVDVTSVKFWFVYVSSFNSLQLPGKCSVDVGCKIHCLNMFLFVKYYYFAYIFITQKIPMCAHGIFVNTPLLTQYYYNQ